MYDWIDQNIGVADMHSTPHIPVSEFIAHPSNVTHLVAN